MGRYRVRSALYGVAEKPKNSTGKATGRRIQGKKGIKGPYRKDSDPRHTRVRRPHNYTPESQHRILRKYDQAKRGERGAVRNLGKEFGIDPGTIARIARRDKDRGTLKRAPQSGRPPIASIDDVEALRDFARARKYCFTYQEVECELRDDHGWTETTARRWVKENCNERWARVKPLLREENFAKRLSFARAEKGGACSNTVHLDEKNFFTWRKGGKMKVLKEDDGPLESDPAVQHIQSKTKVPHIMVIAVVARPRANFDGRILMRRVAEKKIAKRDSKYRKKGSVDWVDTTMNAKWFRELCEAELFPQIAKAMRPFHNHVFVQMDGASPHTGKDNVRLLNEIGAKLKPTIEVKLQPPQSPDVNVLDLCLFSSWARRNHKFQRHARAGDKRQLWTNIQRSWSEYPSDKIERSFQNRELALRKIVELNGGNRFNIPHVTAAKRASLLAPI